jgi:hypothetical protein
MGQKVSGRQAKQGFVSLWLWRAAVTALVSIVIVGLAAALWLGTRPMATGTLAPASTIGTWTLGPGASGGESDGRFTLRAQEANRVVFATSELSLTDLAVQVRAVPLSGPADAGYGLVVRHRGPDEFVALLIGADGYIAVGQMSGGAWRWRVPWQQWPHIWRGSAENLLRAECRADRCRFFVNGEFAFGVDSLPTKGRIGPAIWKPTQADSVTAEFREWRLWNY